MNNNQTQEQAASVNPLSQRANAEFGSLEPIIVNRDMALSAVKQLKDIEFTLQTNIDTYVAENGGEAEVDVEVKDGQHESLSLARFKIEIVRTTVKRFEEQLARATQTVDQFTKV